MSNQAPRPDPQLLPLDLRPGEPLSLVGPALAAVAGALASGRLAPDAATLVTLALAVFLADSLLGGLWASVTGAGWQERWSAATPAPGRPLHLPHTVDGSAAHRLAGALSRLGAASGGEAGGGLPIALTRAAFFFTASLALAAVLGPEAMLLVAAAAVLAGLQAVLGAYVPGVRWPEPLSLFFVPWLVGLAAFGGLPARAEGLPQVALAAAWTAAYFGFRGLALGDPAPRALAALDGGQVAAVILLVLLGRPWQAGLVMVLLAAQAMWQPRFWRDRDGAACAAGSLPYLFAAVLVSFV